MVVLGGWAVSYELGTPVRPIGLTSEREKGKGEKDNTGVMEGGGSW